ncbi:hypothetical protein BZA70DRAFT_279904 [Myxozyma melibiosi]|uniref:Zn(2)-C6 fungal-type domain-containing protein n=1 Tax=Myxozyma melibiosi TaxID=54550 RepID=A0ABR1F4F6_9ASCO
MPTAGKNATDLSNDNTSIMNPADRDRDRDDSTRKKRSLSDFQDDKVDYPRRRAIIACEVCRARKSKCDGAQPKCRLCSELNADCVYRERGLKLDARDKLIIEKLERIESLLESSAAEKDLRQQSTSSQQSFPEISNFQQNLPQNYNLTVAKPPSPSTTFQAGSPAVSSSSRDRTSGSIGDYVFSIPEHHSTPWLHLFQNRQVARLLTQSPPMSYSPLRLESTRSPLQLDLNVLLDLSHIQPLVSSYFKVVNPFYAIVSPFGWQSYYRIALSNGFRQGPESVIVLLVLALGQASLSDSLTTLPKDAPIPGINFFATAWPLITNCLLGNTIVDAQALMLTSAYLFYLVRPLDAWNMISAICTKVRAVLSISPPDDLLHDDRELFERLFWNALVLESDLLAELDLPHSGIELHEDEVGLPSGFRAVDNIAPGTDDLWYFLAEISLRRLLNRVHHMLYSNIKPKVPISSYHPIVQELDFQLTQWYENLPVILKFTFERERIENQFATVLRLRYFACQSIIWRVYVEVCLENEELLKDSRMRTGASKCIEACLRQVEDLDEHIAGHIPYLWQGSLSIAGHIVTLMAVTVSPGLAALLPHSMTRMAEIIVVGVRTIVRNGALAPSIKAAADSLCNAEVQWTKRMMEIGIDAEKIRETLVEKPPPQE